MLVTAFGMCAIPFCKQALLLTGLMSSIGMSMGVLDTGKSALGYTLLRVHPRYIISSGLGIRQPHSTTLSCKLLYRRLQWHENIVHN